MIARYTNFLAGWGKWAILGFWGAVAGTCRRVQVQGQSLVHPGSGVGCWLPPPLPLVPVCLSVIAGSAADVMVSYYSLCCRIRGKGVTVNRWIAGVVLSPSKGQYQRFPAVSPGGVSRSPSQSFAPSPSGFPVPTLCSLACGLKFGILFLGVTSISFNAPAGTPSALAASRMADTFPHVANSVNLAILVESLEAGVNITSAPVRAGHMNVRRCGKGGSGEMGGPGWVPVAWGWRGGGVEVAWADKTIFLCRRSGLCC